MGLEIQAKQELPVPIIENQHQRLSTKSLNQLKLYKLVQWLIKGTKNLRFIRAALLTSSRKMQSI